MIVKLPPNTTCVCCDDSKVLNDHLRSTFRKQDCMRGLYTQSETITAADAPTLVFLSVQQRTTSACNHT